MDLSINGNINTYITRLLECLNDINIVSSSLLNIQEEIRACFFISSRSQLVKQHKAQGIDARASRVQVPLLLFYQLCDLSSLKLSPHLRIGSFFPSGVPSMKDFTSVKCPTQCLEQRRFQKVKAALITNSPISSCPKKNWTLPSTFPSRPCFAREPSSSLAHPLMVPVTLF